MGGLPLHVRWEWLLVGAAVESLSLLSLSFLQQRLLVASGLPVRLRRLVPITLAGNAVAMSIPAGVLAAEGYVYTRYRRLGASAAGAAWTELSAGALAAAALAAVAFAGALVADNGLRAVLLPTLSIVLAGALVAVALFRRTRWLASSARWTLSRVERHVPAAVARRLRRIEVEAQEMVRFEPGVGLWTVGFSAAVLNWVLDAIVLLAAIAAVGARVPWWDVLLAYAGGQLLMELPITPGGLGVVEGGLVAMLTRFHMSAPAATAAVLAYRVVSFWLLVAVGWVAVARLRWRERLDVSTASPPSLRVLDPGGRSRH